MAIHWGGRGPGHTSRSIGGDYAVRRVRALAAQGGQPAALASPPAITLGVANASTTIPGGTTTYNWDSANILRTAGAWQQYGAVFPNTLAGRGKTVTFLAAGVSDAGTAYAKEFYFTGRYIEPYCLNKGFRWTLFVDGEYVALPDIPSAGGGVRTLIDFGATVTGKQIRIEHQGDGQMAIIEILTESTATVTAVPAYPDTLVILGDSYTEGNGAASQRVAMAHMIATELGFSDHRISGSGGTGFVQSNPGIRINGFDRWTTDVVTPGPTMFISLMGSNDVNDGNDATIETTLATKLDELIVAEPDCLIHICGPINASAPSIPTGYAGLNTAIQNACAGKPRVWFHDISDISFTKWDGTHPDAAGHVALYKAIYNKIAAVHGLHTVA